MSLKKFSTDLLNIEPSKILKIESTVGEDSALYIYIHLVPSIKKCKYCGGKVTIHGYTKRKLTHSTFANRKCYLFYYQRRYYCHECETTFTEANPFTDLRENVTIETKSNVLIDLKSPTSTYTAVAKRYNLSTTKVMRIFDNHVKIDRKPLPEVLSIDEHYFPNSDRDSLYMAILMDFNTGTIIDVLEDRRKDSLDRYFYKIKIDTMNKDNETSELSNVKYVSIDLWQPYKDIARKYFPSAIICADSFHVLKHLTLAFRDVRLKCRRETEDETMRYLLIKFSYVLNHGTYLDNIPKYNKRLGRYVNCRDIRDIMFDRFPLLKQAYDLKESYIDFNNSKSSENISERLTTLTKQFADSQIEQYVDFCNLLETWHDEIVNSFTLYNGRRINNSYIESRNRTIETLLYNANGFSNFTRTRNRILYCLNKDDNYKL